MTDKPESGGNTPQGLELSATQRVGTRDDGVVGRLISAPSEEVVARVLASGSGAIVAKIEEAASRYDIPLLQDALLTGLLAELPSEDPIPQSVYATIGDVLSFINRASNSDVADS